MAVVVKGVGIAVDGDPDEVAQLTSLGMLIVARAVVVSGANAVVLPHALHQAVGEVVLDAVEGPLAVDASVVLAEVVPTAFNFVPALGQDAADGVVVFAVDHVQAAAGDGLAAVAGQLVAYNVEAVAGGWNGSAPFHHGVTALAEGSAGVAVLGASGRLVGQGNSAVDVGGAVAGKIGRIHVIPGGVHLGRDAELLVGEGLGAAVGEGDKALVHIQSQIVAPELMGGPVLRSSLARDMNVVVIVKHAHGDLREDRAAGLIIFAGAGKGNRCRIGILINRIFRSESLCEYHVIELPVIDHVQVNHGLHGLDILDGSCLQIHPVNGAEEDPIEARISRNQLEGRRSIAGLNLEDADHDRSVARVVGDLKSDAVIAIGNRDVGCGHHAADIGSRNLNTVDKGLCSGGIDAGGVRQRMGNLVRINLFSRISHVGCKGQRVRRCGTKLVLDERSAVHIDLIEFRLFSVVNRLRVVHGKVVQIERVGSDNRLAVKNRIVLRSGKNKGDEEVALSAACACAGILDKLHRILQRDVLVLAQIHLQIIPARLVNLFKNLIREGGRHRNQTLGVVGAVTVRVSHVVALGPQLDALVRDIHPEAQGAGVLQLNCITIDADSNPAILSGVGQVGGQAVQLKAHGVLAVMNLAVFRVRQGEGHVIIPDGALPVVDDVPDVHVGLATLKVKEHVRASAQLELEVQGGIAAHVQGSSHIAGDVFGSILLVNRREAQTVEAAQGRVVRGEADVIGAKANLIQTVIDSSLDGNRRRLAVGNRHGGLVHGNRFRNRNINLAFTHDIAVVNQLRSNDASRSVGGKDAVGDGAHAVFRNLPLGVLRDIDLRAGGVDAHGIEAHGAAGGVVVVVAADSCAGQLAVSRSGRNNHNGRGYRSLTAVGQGAVDLQILTGTLGAEGGGAAAVLVAGIDTAHTDHVVRHFAHGEAGGEGGLIAVGYSNNNLAIRGDANECSRSNAGAMVVDVVRSLRVAVCIGLHEPLPGRNCVLFPTGQRVAQFAHQNLGDAVGSRFTGRRINVVVDYENAVVTGFAHAVGRAVAVLIVIAVQNRVSQGLADQLRMLLVVCFGIPAKGGVRRGNDIAVTKLFGAKRLLGHGLRTILARLRNHALVARKDVGVGVVQVDLDGVDDLPPRTGSVVDDNLCFLDAGSQLPILLGNQLVVGGCSRFIVLKRCSNACRKEADNHHNRKEYRQTFCRFTFHFMCFLHNRFFRFCGVPVVRMGVSISTDHCLVRWLLATDCRSCCSCVESAFAS